MSNPPSSSNDTEAFYPAPKLAFAELAATYDARLAGDPLLLLESGALFAALPDMNGANVVDFACGTGRYALQLVRAGANVTGIDFCPEMLAVTRRKARRQELPISLVEGELEQQLPLPASSFNVGVCALALAYLANARQAFSEMARLLQPGASLVLSDRHPHGLFAARAESLGSGRRNDAPYLRFTTSSGEDWRIRQYPRTISELWAAANDAGLALEFLDEPVADRRLASTYPTLRPYVGLPLALIARFRKLG